MNKTILHFIDSLGRGGAETVLVNTVKELKGFRNIVLYLHGPHDLKDDIRNAELICLHKNEKRNFFWIVSYLRRFIRENHVDIIHSHAFWTHILARLVVDNQVKLVNSYHFADYDTLGNLPSVRFMIQLDKLTYKPRYELVAVSDYMKSVLEKVHPNHSRIQSIPNFIDDKFYTLKRKLNPWEMGEELKIIVVGNIKIEKNYELLIDACGLLKNEKLKIDVYGGGELLDLYREKVKAKRLRNIEFKGPSAHIDQLLGEYHVFCMSSISEACPLAPIQAMSVGLPLLLSDICALKEIGGTSAIFFLAKNHVDLATKIKDILTAKVRLLYGVEHYRESLSRYSKEKYFNHLKVLYNK